MLENMPSPVLLYVLLTDLYDGFCFSFHCVHRRSYLRDVNALLMGWRGVLMVEQGFVFR